MTRIETFTVFNVSPIFDSGADKYRHNASTNRYEFIMQYARSAYGKTVIVDSKRRQDDAKQISTGLNT